jgi:hypothetical protein
MISRRRSRARIALRSNAEGTGEDERLACEAGFRGQEEFTIDAAATAVSGCVRYFCAVDGYPFDFIFLDCVSTEASVDVGGLELGSPRRGERREEEDF